VPGSSDPIRERVVDIDGGFNIVQEQNCDSTIEAVHGAADFMRKRPKNLGARYLGSVPLVVAQQWAKECGCAIGTKEYLVYAQRQIMDGAFAKFRAKLQW